MYAIVGLENIETIYNCCPSIAQHLFQVFRGCCHGLKTTPWIRDYILINNKHKQNVRHWRALNM